MKLDPDFGRDTRRGFAAYAVYALAAGLLAVGAWGTHGIVSLVLAILAVMFALVTVWSVLFMGGVLWLVRYLSRLSARLGSESSGPDEEHPPDDELDP